MIKAIIFDLGNVIYSFDNGKFIERISRFSDKSKEELKDLIYKQSGLPKLYETGLISSDEFIDKIKELCGLNMEKEEFIRAYTEIFTPIPETFELIRKLKPNYKLGLLSNTSELDFQIGQDVKEVRRLFEHITLSYELKAMKPAKDIYLDMLRKLELPAEECVYIDDIEKYVEAAEDLGIKGIHYTSPEKLVESLKQLGVKV
jgi:putative hydrolase of the HAD superfamily